MKIGFILLPGYSSMAYVSAVEPLLVCNQLTGEDCYQVTNACIEGHETISSLGNQVCCDYNLATLPVQDAYFIAGPAPAAYRRYRILDQWLTQLPADTVLAGLSSGSYDLARAHLLDGYRAVVHWWKYEQLLENYPAVILSADAYCVDRIRYTCRGGSASLDMMLFLLARQQGIDTAEAVARYFAEERQGNHPQRAAIPLSRKAHEEQPKLSEALALMEANIEEPLTTDDIAHHVGVSRRQLERLFRKHLNSVPSRYYLQTRLEKARSMLLESSSGIGDIGLACGFSSGAHFSTAYRAQFGITPSEERKLSQQMIPGE